MAHIVAIYSMPSEWVIASAGWWRYQAVILVFGCSCVKSMAFVWFTVCYIYQFRMYCCQYLLFVHGKCFTEDLA